MKNLIFIILSALMGCSSERLGTCDIEKQVTFRDISFQFPITAYDALQFSGKIMFNGNELVKTDSIMKNISATWFYEANENEFYATDSINFLKDAFIYGVTFILWAEQHKTDAQIIGESQKEYPGHYEYVKQFDRHYYIHRRGCLTIILKREPDYEKPFPSVSFCYGLDDLQEQYYGYSTGHWVDFDQ